MTHLRSVLAGLLVLLCLGVAQPVAARAESCEAAGFVRSAGQAYDRAAGAGTVEAYAAAADRYSDIRAIGLFALGRYRNELPKNREAEYIRLTKQFIGEMLKDYGSDFQGGGLDVTDCKSANGLVIVGARASNGSRLIFKLDRRGGGYTVKDVNMQGVWLAQQMRTTFVGTIARSGSIEALFRYLRG